jgi:hypothetical protein
LYNLDLGDTMTIEETPADAGHADVRYLASVSMRCSRSFGYCDLLHEEDCNDAGNQDAA